MYMFILVCSSWCQPGESTTPAQVIFCGPILCLQDDSPERVMMLLQSSPVLSAYGYITSGATLLSVPEGLSIANASLQHRLVDLEITMDHEQAYPHTQPAHPPLSTIDRHLSRVRPPCPTFHPVIARCRHSPSGAVRQYSEASGPLQPPSH